MGFRNSPSAATIVRAALFVGVVMTAVCCIAAMQLPSLEPALRLKEERIVLEGTAAEHEIEVRRLRSAAGIIELEPTDLLEEPDFLLTWEGMDRFFARQTRLLTLLNAQNVEVQITDSRWVPLQVGTRSLQSIPWVFYLQLFAALWTWLAGLATYAYSDRGPGAKFYAASAVGMAVVIWPAAIYSSRPLAMNGAAFDVLSSIDHLGGFIYCTGVVSLFASYPVRLFRGVSLIWVTVPLAMLIEEGQLLPKGSFDLYNAATGYFAFLLLLAPWQWLKCRRDPISRAALGWIFLCSLVGMSFFISTVTFPMVLGLPTRASQAVGLSAYALTYAGVSLGVLKLRLFDLDRWWFRTWVWLVGGAFVLSLDFLLMSTFELATRESMFVALAVAGWLYFPARQWLLGFLTRRQEHGARADVNYLAASATTDELTARYERALSELFAPLRIEHCADAVDSPKLGAFGSELRTPGLTGGHLVCHFRNAGKNLYRARDVTEALELWTLCSSIARAITARNQGQNEERDRIRRDLHDDMGASIISIIHAADQPRVADLARKAMRDLRNVLLALSPSPADVMEVLEDLRVEVASLVPDSPAGFSWEVKGREQWQLSGRERANLVRAFREATTNALKHGSGGLSYEFEVNHEGIRGVLQNPHQASDSEQGGLGLSNIEGRIREIGGSVHMDTDGGFFRLSAYIPRGP